MTGTTIDFASVHSRLALQTISRPAPQGALRKVALNPQPLPPRTAVEKAKLGFEANSRKFGNPAADRAIIVVGGRHSLPGAERGIIVVGGRGR